MLEIIGPIKNELSKQVNDQCKKDCNIKVIKLIGRNEINKLETKYESELNSMKKELEKLLEKENKNKIESGGYYYTTETQSSNKQICEEKVNEELNELKRRIDNNDRKIDDLFVFVDKKLKLTETNVLEEIQRRIDEAKDVTRTEQKSEVDIEYYQMIQELNESIKKCIAETDNFCNNLRQGIDSNSEGILSNSF